MNPGYRIFSFGRMNAMSWKLPHLIIVLGSTSHGALIICLQLVNPPEFPSSLSSTSTQFPLFFPLWARRCRSGFWKDVTIILRIQDKSMRSKNVWFHLSNKHLFAVFDVTALSEVQKGVREFLSWERL